MIYISVNVTKQSYFLWHYFFNTASRYISQFQILHNFKLPHLILTNFYPSVVLPTTWYVIFTTYVKKYIFLSYVYMICEDNICKHNEGVVLKIF